MYKNVNDLERKHVTLHASESLLFGKEDKLYPVSSNHAKPKLSYHMPPCYFSNVEECRYTCNRIQGFALFSILSRSTKILG